MKKKDLILVITSAIASVLTFGVYYLYKTYKNKDNFKISPVHQTVLSSTGFHKRPVAKIQAQANIPTTMLWIFGIIILMLLMGMMQMDTYLRASVIDAKNATTVVKEARKYIGVPYILGAQPTEKGNRLEPGYDAKHNGPGADCSSFTQIVYHNSLGVDLPRISRDQAKVSPRVDLSKVQPGDLLFFEIYGSDISHVSMVTGKEGDKVKVIHASTWPQENVKEEVLSGKYWRDAFRFATKMPGSKQKVVTLSNDEDTASDYSEDLKTHMTQTEPTAEELVEKQVVFKDINNENNNFYKSIAYAASKDIINSGETINFRPYGTLSRAEAVKIIAEALNISPEKTIDDSFPDVVARHHWVGKYLKKITARGIINGYENGEFGIDDPLTSEQLIKILYNAFNIVDKSGKYDDVPEDHWASKYVGPFSRYDLFPTEDNKIGFETPISREKTIETVYRVLKYKNKL